MTSIVDTLEPWCAAGATGALRIGGGPGGAVYLRRGRITQIECPLACGLDRMLVASGRMSADAVRTARVAGLTGPGRLAPIELEAMLLATIHSAADFLLAGEVAEAGADVQFEMGAEHPFAGAVELDLPGLRAEVGRRRGTLRAIWPHDHVDTAPVRPARRIDGHHVGLTASQWEITVNANRRRTPIDLAKLLGHDTYATILSVRRMVASGLLETGPPPVVVVVEAPITKPRRIRPSSRAEARPNVRTRSTPSTKAAAILPRREPLTDVRAGAPDDAPDLSDHELMRIRDALQALR
jgi:hypothetical protein